MYTIEQCNIILDRIDTWNLLGGKEKDEFLKELIYEILNWHSSRNKYAAAGLYYYISLYETRLTSVVNSPTTELIDTSLHAMYSEKDKFPNLAKHESPNGIIVWYYNVL